MFSGMYRNHNFFIIFSEFQFYENDNNLEHSADNVYEINLIELYFQITSDTRLQLSSLLQVQYSS